MSSKGGYTRWYDRTSHMSQAVKLLEIAPEPFQKAIAHSIVSQVDIGDITKRNGIKKIGTHKVIGLMKSKTKRRWYDQDPIMHQAFNYLYIMNGKQCDVFALKIIISLNALEQASSGLSKGQNHAKVYQGLVDGIFGMEVNTLLSKTNVIIENSQKSTHKSLLDSLTISLGREYSHRGYSHDEPEETLPLPPEKQDETLEKPAIKKSNVVDHGDGMRITQS